MWLLCRGLDMDGKLVNGPVRDYSWSEIVERSSKGSIQSNQSFEKLAHVFTVVVVSGNNDQNPTFFYLDVELHLREQTSLQINFF